MSRSREARKVEKLFLEVLPRSDLHLNWLRDFDNFERDTFSHPP